MSTFCDRTKVKNDLGPYVDPDDLSDAEIDAHITQVSGEIMGRLGDDFSPFNDYNGTPATPPTIRTIAEEWSTAESLRQIVGTANEAAMEEAAQRQEIGEVKIARIEEDPDSWGHRELTTGYAISFGDQDAFPWTVQENWAVLASPSPISAESNIHPPFLLRDTLRFTAGDASAADFSDAQLLLMRNGYEFEVGYEGGFWILQSNVKELHEAVTGLQGRYEWSYKRVIGVRDASPAVSWELV